MIGLIYRGCRSVRRNEDAINTSAGHMKILSCKFKNAHNILINLYIQQSIEKIGLL